MGRESKHGEERRKCWLPAFSPFSSMFSRVKRLPSKGCWKSGFCTEQWSYSTHIVVYELNRLTVIHYHLQGAFYAPASIDWGAYSFWPVRLFVHKNFYIGHRFWIASDSAFTFHIYIPWGKTLSLVPKSRSSVKVKVKYQGHRFWKNVTVALVFHIHNLFHL